MIARSLRKFKETVEIQSLPFNRLRRHRYFPLTVIITVLLLAASFHIWQRVEVIRLVKEVAHLQQQNRSLVNDTHKVHSDISTLSMAVRIEKYATDTLGLKQVKADHLFTLVPEERSTLPADEFATMLSSIKRVADYLPVVTEVQAGERELKPIRFDLDDPASPDIEELEVESKR